MDPVAEITEKKCRTCGRTKSNDQFNKATTHFGGDGFMKDCKKCRAKKRAEGSGGGQLEDGSVSAARTGPHLVSSPTIGFQAFVSGEDLVIEQTSEQNGQVSIWLSQGEARQLAGFIARLGATCFGNKEDGSHADSDQASG